MIKITFLADHPHVIPVLVDWFQAQWPVYYAGRTPADIARDFQAECGRDGLPVRLVAWVEGSLAGTICLRDTADRGVPESHPGLGGLLVDSRYRGRGIGTALVRAGMDLAREMGFARVYATTINARGILERLGWTPVQKIAHGEELLDLYSFTFERAGPEPPGPDKPL